MAHYAFIDSNNIVSEVIVGIDETEFIDGLNPETWYSNFKGKVCKRTSYNNKIRFNYAGIGYFYDATNDAFVAPKCHGIALLNAQFRWDCNDEEHQLPTI